MSSVLPVFLHTRRELRHIWPVITEFKGSGSGPAERICIAEYYNVSPGWQIFLWPYIARRLNAFSKTWNGYVLQREKECERPESGAIRPTNVLQKLNHVQPCLIDMLDCLIPSQKLQLSNHERKDSYHWSVQCIGSFKLDTENPKLKELLVTSNWHHEQGESMSLEPAPTACTKSLKDGEQFLRGGFGRLCRKIISKIAWVTIMYSRLLQCGHRFSRVL